MEETIGSNAGVVWSLLNQNGETALKAVKKATKLKDKDLWAALGWLAREGKVTVDEKEEDVFVALAE